MRERVAFLVGEQRGRYAGKPLPLSQADERAWQGNVALLAAMEAAYRRLLGDALASTGELHRHAALAAQRVLRYVGAQVGLFATIHRRCDPALLQRLNEAYARAESAGLVDERVRDSLEGNEGGSAVGETYAQVLLLHAAMHGEHTTAQADFVDAIARAWASKVVLRRSMPEETLPPAQHPLVADVEGSAGAVPLPPREVTQRHRILDTAALSRSIRRRIQGLRAGEDIAQMKLPVQAAGVDAAVMLEKLHRAWCEVPLPRAPARAPDVQSADVVLGVSGIHFFVTGGKAFEAPDRDFTPQEKQDIEVFGQVSSRTQSLRAAEHVLAKSESWTVLDELLGAWRLRRPPKATQAIAVGRLVAMRLTETAPFFLGMVKSVVQEADGAIVMTVTLFPGKPEPVAVRADSRGRAPGKWQEGFRLPALPKLNLAASLVVPIGVAVRGRGVELWDENAKALDVATYLERGVDFDRVALA
jgi:hypothetical protein